MRTDHQHKSKLSQQTLLKFFQHVQQKHSRPDPLSFMGFCWLNHLNFWPSVSSALNSWVQPYCLCETPGGHLYWRKVCCISCITESLFPGLFVTDLLFWLWLAIGCFYLNKQVSSPSFSQDVLPWNTSETKWVIHIYLISDIRIYTNMLINQSLNWIVTSE